MFKNILVFLLAASLPAVPLFAQQLERMETDRPDQTESPFIVPAKWVQLEIGFNFEKNGPGLHTLVYPTLLSKYGISKRLEFRLITNLLTNRESTGSRYETTTGIEPVQVGFKVALMEEKGLLPKISLIAHVAIAEAATAKMQAESAAPNFVFTMQHSITKSMALGYNLGAEWDGFSNSPAWIYRISPGFNIGKKWYAYAEAFGFIKKQETADHNIDGGIAYFLNDNVKFDLSAGKGLSAISINYYFALGASIRFPL
ncbi:MAG: transporter [Chitinophagaceae bacterium]